MKKAPDSTQQALALPLSPGYLGHPAKGPRKRDWEHADAVRSLLTFPDGTRMSESELARRSHISRNSVFRILHGHVRPTLDSAMKLLAVLDHLSPRQLLEHSNRVRAGKRPASIRAARAAAGYPPWKQIMKGLK